MKTSSNPFSLVLKLALGLSLLGWVIVAGAATILSNRVVSAAAPSPTSGLTSETATSALVPANRASKTAPDLSSSSIFSSHASQGRVLRVRPSSAAPGSILTVPVDLFAQGDEHSVQFSLRFDSSLLTFTTAELGPERAGAQLVINYNEAASGLLGVSIILPNGSAFESGDNRVLELKFSVAEGRTRKTSFVEFADSPVRRGTADTNSRELLVSYSSGTVEIAAAIEGDVAPRPDGSADGALTVGDWIQAGRFVAVLDQTISGSEFQRADSAPRSTSGDGRISLADWVQVGRYSESLDSPQPAAGPTTPTAFGEGSASAGFASSAESESQIHVLRVPDDTFTRGQDNELVVEMDALGDENAVSFTLSYNPAHMTFVRATLGTGVPQPANPVVNINTVQLGLGRVGIALALRAGSNFGVGTRQLLVIAFTVPLNGNQNTSSVGFGDGVIGRAVVNTNADTVTAAFNPGNVTFLPTVNAVPILSSISPSFVIVGGPTFTLIVNGTDFVNGAAVRVNGQERATRFVSSGELQAFVPASDITETALLSISVVNPPPGGGVSAALTLSVNNPLPTIFDVSPSVVGLNSGSQLLTISGSSFVQGAQVRWNGAARQTTFVNANLLTATIVSTDVNAVGTASVTVFNPSPGGGVSNALTVTIIAASPIPRITALDPANWPIQGGAFALRIIGTSFAQNAVGRWAGDPRPTTFVSNTELIVQISAADVSIGGDVLVSVVNPPPGGGNSNNAVFSVSGSANPAPVLTSINPNTVVSGGPDFPLTLSGSGFIGTSAVQVNGQSRATTFVNSSQLQSTIFAADITSAGVLQIRVSTPAPGGGLSAQLPLTITLGTPTIIFLSPNSALVGGPGFSLTVIGSSFTANSVVRWNGSPRVTEFFGGTELRAQIPATDIAALGTGSALVTVFAPPPGGGASNAALFTLTQSDNPLPRINSFSPTQATSGGPGFTLTINGTGFIPGSLVRWNGSPRQTTLVNATQLTAQITAADIASTGTAQITVFNSTPGGGTSNPVNFSITSQAGNPPVITSITPSTVNAGGQGLTLAVEGANFTPLSVVQFNSDTRPTTFIASNQLTALISQADLQFGGLVTINVFNPPPGAGTSNVVNLTIRNPVPSISNVVPSRIGTGSGSTFVTVNGSSFVQGVVVQINGSNRTTTFINSSQVTVTITGTDRQVIGPLTLVAINPSPGGGSSNNATLDVVANNPLPRLISISPDAANAGSPGLTLVLTGSNFAPNAVVRWANRDLQTEFLSTNTLTATVTANDLILGGNVSVRVFNPEPGGGTTGVVLFAINSPVPFINNVSPNPVTGTGLPVTITVDGGNFVGSSVVRFNNSPRQTVFLGTTQLAATLLATDLVGITSASITVLSPEPGGGVSNAVNIAVIPGNAPVPAITSLNPGAVIVGSVAFSLTVNGAGFVPGSVVSFNGSARATTFVSATQLLAAITAADVANVSTAVITVFSPAPGGGTSNPFNFGIIAAPPPAPSLTSLAPSSATVGTPFILTANGANFAPTSVVLVNGAVRGTTFVSGSQLTAQILAGDVAAVANLSITVFTPAPGGGTSNTLILSVVTNPNPVPAIVSLSPVSATVGGAGLILTVNGSNFVGGSVVRFNGVNQATTFVSSMQLTALIPNVGSAGTASITVFNPAPGGGTSNTLLFGINPPGPPPSCSTICLRSAKYYERNTNRLPSGLVVIGGANANAPIQIQGNTPLIKSTLQGSVQSALGQLNMEYLAIQISLLLSGSSSVGGLQSSPSCYGVTFGAVLLSNGVTLTPSSSTSDILAQVRGAILENRFADMPALTSILALMNGDDPTSTCNRPVGAPTSFGPDPESTPMRQRRELDGRGIR